MGLKEMLQVWVDHRRVVIRRRSEYRKKKALERCTWSRACCWPCWTSTR